MGNEIALRIYGGGATTGLDRRPIISVGAVSPAFIPTPPSIVDEPQSWMIVHGQDYTMYALHSRKWKTASGEAGQLLVGLFFPASRRLADGKSPLSLLDSIVDVFSILHAGDERIPSGEQDSSPFKSLLQRYELEDRPTSLPVMQGSEAASYCVENSTQLDALMRHSRYDTLAKVGRLELGFHCPTTVGLVLGRPGKQPAAQKLYAAEPAPALKPAPQPEPEPQPAPEAKPEPIPEPILEPTPIPESETKSESKPETKPESKSEKKRLLLWVLAGVAAVVAVIWGIRLISNPYSKLTVSGEHGGVEYVDLGLSVQWARCNLGASAPIQFGEIFPWGETSYKPAYNYENYKFYSFVNDSLVQVTKYSYDSGLLTLLPEDDVAHVRLKGSWRMPTLAECRELLENCDAKRTKVKGQSGYLFTSRINGNTLFLPMLPSGGAWEHSEYWTSSLYVESDFFAGVFAEDSENALSSEIFGSRVTACMIRPVYALPGNQIGGTPLAKEAENAYYGYKNAADAVEAVINNSSFTAEQVRKAWENLWLLKTMELSYASVDSRYYESIRLQPQLDQAIQSGLERMKKEADKMSSKEKRARAYYDLLQIREDASVRKAYNDLAVELQGILCADFVMMYRGDGEGNYAERIDYHLVDGVMKKDDNSKITASRIDYLRLYFELDTFEGLESESKYNTQTFYIKYFTPAGELMTGTGSPSGYTFKSEHTDVMERGKIWALGWGNTEQTAYRPGTYTVEVYTSKGRRLFRVPVELK